MKEKIKNLNVSKSRILLTFFSMIILVFCTVTFVITYSQIKNKIIDNTNTELSGVIDNVVYINDLESDYYHYMGLNYTENSSGTLPDGNNQKLYSESNLVQVMITYSGIDLNNQYHGYISNTELQDTFIYYKVYPVQTNGTTSKEDDYIEIELIDNPFTNRPQNQGFNGWITNDKGIEITYDQEYYTRYAKVPIKYVKDIPEKLEITFHASWVLANVSNMNSSTSWATAFSNLNNAGMHSLSVYEIMYGEVDMTGYYYEVNINRNESCTGYYDRYGEYQENCRCNSWWGGCTYYERIENENFNENNEYYQLEYGSMTQVDNDTIERPILGTGYVNGFKENSNMAGFYRRITIPRNSSINGYYDDSGNKVTGNCTSNNGCTYYELIQYYDKEGNLETVNSDINYYYLVTRDTNIIVMNGSVNNKWSSSQNKPFTLTSLYNGSDYRSSVTWTVSSQAIICYEDTTIENIKISAGQTMNSIINPPSSNSTSRTLYGYWNNVKLGRGITRSGNYTTFNAVLGGYNQSTGSSSNPTKYKLIIESGFYNSISMTIGANTSSRYTDYVMAKSVYGSDYDRAIKNNENLEIYYCASGSWSGSIYSSSNISVGLNLVVKSGEFGTSRYDNTTGIYVGGRYGGTHYTPRQIKVEGGWIYNVIGGPLTASSRSNYNDTYIYVTGGAIDMITGGAGQTATYGHRIIQVTGGTINYSVFGGSNGYDGSEGDGTVNGSSFIYIGGNSTIGDTNYINNNQTLYGSEAGSVFGIGNGRNGYSTIGSSDNSNIIIADEAIINQNVYGGGNYGAVGVSSSFNSTVTNIQVQGGTVRGSIYGGGNNNDSGAAKKLSTVNITMKDGIVEGSIYGGSNQVGTIYGTTNVKVYGGAVNGSIYGGGRGGYSSNRDLGTFVSENVNVYIGTSTTSPVIYGNVFGGSALGTVNGTNINPTSDYKTNVTVDNGQIKGSIYGGGQGSTTFTPYVGGNITVTINGGTIENVYGGNDVSGVPNGTSTVYLKGGTITSVYGGGNQTSLPTSNVYLQGSKVNQLFGGSNQSGTVDSSNIITTSGNATTIYGGNNIGGTTNQANIKIDGGTITTIYGGGRLTTTSSTDIQLNSANITDVYGGGESADVTNATNVTLNGSKVINLYGGSNTSGTIPTSNILTNKGTVSVIYGGNNAGGTTNTTNITVKGGNITDIYGGGNKANTTISNVNILSSSNRISNVFGGGKQADAEVTNVHIYGGQIDTVFGGSNISGAVTKSNVIVDKTESSSKEVSMEVSYTASPTESWQSTIYPTIVTVQVTLYNKTNIDITNWEASIIAPNSILANNYSNTNIEENNGTYMFNQQNRYYGTNVIPKNGTYSFEYTIYSLESKDNFVLDYTLAGKNSNGIEYSDSTLTIPKIKTIYGGNNAGGITKISNINIHEGTIDYVYGGGYEAVTEDSVVNIQNATIQKDVYGGGNKAGIMNYTDVDVIGATIHGNVFGGGNAATVGKDTNVYVSNANIYDSVYAGGNGITAVVNGNTLLNIDGTTNIKKHVFGGGNAAATGSEAINNSKGIVNIAGATIGGNVYGGANTSVLYGTVELNIGYTLVDSSLIKGDIHIKGTVFGGGEANASGDENYDYSFISVTTGIIINIDGSLHDNFKIEGSIFGSGNASSTTGYSYINMKNYGTLEKYQKNISIQRANIVTLDNSYIELVGATDRTNEYSTTLFTISRVDELKLKNSSTVYLQTGANLLKKLSSLVDNNGVEVKAQVTIDENGNTTRNVDNRVYMYDGKNLNIATNESVTTYGEVYGMTFFGMYVNDRNDVVQTAYFDPKYQNGSTVATGDFYAFSSGSYVLGRHNTNHNIKEDGFYTNIEDEQKQGTVKVIYIEPTPEDSNYYMWVIGEMVSSYELDLVASKYSTLGTYELPLINSSEANTTFTIVGFSYNDINSDFELIDQSQIPRIAQGNDADNKMGLTMKTSNQGWITIGSTNFYTNDTVPFSGTIDYSSENASTVPSLLFYLYHSKNLMTEGEIGTVTISLLSITPIDDLNNEVKRINININLSRALYNTNNYEGAMTVGEEYDMFASTSVDITSTSKLSAYYSLYEESEESLYKEGYYRTLVSSYVLPIGTKITMVDLNGTLPEYYYYVVTKEEFEKAQIEFNAVGEASYDIAKFIKMGSSSLTNNYSDDKGNQTYYNNVEKYAHEEFIFIVDFIESGIEEDKLNNTLLFELRNAENQTLINVLGVQHANMTYNLYASKDAVIEIDASLSSDKIYLGETVTLTVNTNFVQQSINSKTIYDTNYFYKKSGIKLSIYDSNGNIVNGSSLLGVIFKYNGITYHPRIDGTVRMNIAERIANISSKIEIDTTHSNLSSGVYTIQIESFGSPDGIYYGLVSSDTKSVKLTVINSIYGLMVNLNENSVIIDKMTGKTNADNNALVFNIDYSSGLVNPNLRIRLYRRNYDTIYSTEYELVDLQDYVTNNLKVKNEFEYLIVDKPIASQTLFLYLKENLTSGTYKIAFLLYDEDTYIGEVSKYLIIK